MLEKLKLSLNNCTNCSLHSSRSNIVFSDGSEDAKIILIGEAPGEMEDKTGTPFVGRAGKLLNELLAKAGIDRKKDLYIINTVKCRPPKNRKPTKEEKKACLKNLNTQIETVNPRVIVLCGSTAMESFIENKKITITKARGEIFKYKNGIKLVPIFHPSFLLRKHSTEPNSPRDLTIRDLIKIKELSCL